MEQVKYSIVIPVYNSEKYIKRALDALLEQNYPDMEIIIVDDGSTDSTEQIIRSSYIRENVKYYKKEHGGPGLARKYGIERCNGRYICLLDADDYVLPGYFCELDRVIDEDTDIVEYGYINEANRKIFPQTLNKDKSALSRLLDLKSRVALWNKVFRHEISDGLEHVAKYYSEDFFIGVQMYKKAEKIKVIDKVLYYHENNLDSLTKREDREIEQAFTNFRVIGLLLERNRDLNCEEERFLRIRMICATIRLYWKLYEKFGEIQKDEEEIIDKAFKKYFSIDILRFASFKRACYILLFAFSKKGSVKIFELWGKLKPAFSRFCKSNRIV